MCVSVTNVNVVWLDIKPTCFTNPPVVSLLSPGLPSRTFARNVSSELREFLFLVSFSYFFVFCDVCYTKLAVSSAFGRK